MAKELKKWFYIGALGIVCILTTIAYDSPFGFVGVILSLISGFGLLKSLDKLD